MSDGAAVMLAAPPIAGKFLATFKDFPPSQRPSSVSIDQLVDKMRRSFDAR
jgi:arylsulfatase